LGSGQKRSVVPRFALPTVPDDLELRGAGAVLEGHVVLFTFAPYPHLEVRRQCVHHGNADAVQAAREGVGLIREFSAGVQAGEDELDAGDLLLRMQIHRHAAAVVAHLERPVGVHGDVDVAAVARDRLVDAVVDDFAREMVGPARVGVHARPATNGIEAAQYLDVRSGVTLGHLSSASAACAGRGAL
jgi:hypothetical protein